MTTALFLAMLAASAAGAPAAGPGCEIDPARMPSWSEFHRLEQRRPPTILEYRGCGMHLVYTSVEHSNDPAGATFRAVRNALAGRRIAFVIVEGFPESLGSNPAGIATHARQVEGTPGDAESFLAIRLALAAGAGFGGGEPKDAEILADVRPAGVTPRDLFAFYILRGIEQWRRERRIAGPDDPALDSVIRGYAPAFAADTGIPVSELSGVATLAGWSAWYETTNRLPYARGYRAEDAHPSGPNKMRRTNRLADAVGDARDRHIVRAIARALAKHGSVLVVYGSSHNVVQGPALEAAFGPPELAH